MKDKKTEIWVQIFQKKTVSEGCDYDYDGCANLQIIAEWQEDQNIDGHSWADRRRGEKHFCPKWTFFARFSETKYWLLDCEPMPPRAGERSDDGAELWDVELDLEVEPQQQDQETHQQEQGEAIAGGWGLREKNEKKNHFNKIKISFKFLKKTAGKVPEQEK